MQGRNSNLRLARETVRELTHTDLGRAAAGVATLLQCLTLQRCDSAPACQLTLSSCIQQTVSC
ncbi:MAG TPA: hypothetical protein VG245_10240 [Candidatus Dormibacteraeota bacterium]|jgi:hypothetical protein|nr:hypothetical protein [Candidatus Dormibacteraeota bacterium]